MKSPERVVEELLNLSDPFVLFVDDNFLADPERSMEIASLFDIAHSVLPIALPLDKFYEEFCFLYPEVYSVGELIKEGFRAWIQGFPLKDF